MKIFRSAAVLAIALALLTTPALARGRGKKESPADAQATADKRAKDAQVEKDYKAAMDRIPDRKPADPWGNVRAAVKQ